MTLKSGIKKSASYKTQRSEEEQGRLNTRLFEALTMNLPLSQIQELLGAGADPKAQEPGTGKTPLMQACWTASLEVVAALLPLSDALARDVEGKTALMLASVGAEEEVVRLLLPASDPLAKDETGWSALMWACERGSPGLGCAQILAPVSELGVKDENGWSAMLIACQQGSEPLARLLWPITPAEARERQGLKCSQLHGLEGVPELEAWLRAMEEREGLEISLGASAPKPRRPGI